MVHYHAAFAELYYREAQAQWGSKELQRLVWLFEWKSIEPMALELAGGNV